MLVVLFVREPEGCAQGPSGSAPSERPEFRLLTRPILGTTSKSSSPPPPDLRLRPEPPARGVSRQTRWVVVPGCCGARLLGPSFFHTITSVPPALAARLPPVWPSSPTNHLACPDPSQVRSGPGDPDLIRMDEKTPKDGAGPREYLNGRYSTVVSALCV